MGKYIAIDLKSFYASVECVDRRLDPLDTNLLVADVSRTEKTICLAVSPSLKAYGISGRARLFEALECIEGVNRERRFKAGGILEGSSYKASELRENAKLELGYITAVPRMARYIEVSSQIYDIYMKYVSEEDIHAYSIDEVFIDAEGYLSMYGGSAHDLAMTMIRDVLRTTGITATAGIGTNMYLCKIAMDIVAKHMAPDKDGVRLAEIDEMSYRRLLWGHKPITDFWMTGSGIAKKLAACGVYTMGDLARFSTYDYGKVKLYKMFGVNAELIIDHAWGYEPCTISDVKAYQPKSNSISSGQVLKCATDGETTRIIVWEMADAMANDLVKKGLVTDRLVLTVGYDVENLRREEIKAGYKGEVKTDHYGRKIPRHAHGTIPLGVYTSSARELTDAAMKLFDRIYDMSLLSRRICIAACDIKYERDMVQNDDYEQLDLFTDYEERERRRLAERREMSLQKAVAALKERYGGNAVLKGTNFCEGATMRERNLQIGGHRA